MNTVHRIATSIFLLCAGLPAMAQKSDAVDPGTLDGKVLLGYQGWVDCPSDTVPNNPWSHWARRGPGGGDVAAGDITVGMYPDLTEFDKSDLCALPGFTVA